MMFQRYSAFFALMHKYVMFQDHVRERYPYPIQHARWLRCAGTILLLFLTACSAQGIQLQPLSTPPALEELQPPIPVLDQAELSLQQPVSVTGLYERVELDVRTSTSVDNPFDPAQIDLLVTFLAPSGAQITVPAFWYQAFDRETLQPLDKPGWKARVSPNEIGIWRAWALLDKKGKSNEISFEVTPSNFKGFIRIDPRNERYFVFDDGTPYFAIGLNIGWSSGGNVLPNYERWLTRLSENGGNLARVWMASWSFGLEWEDTGLGDYSARMKQAWLLDQVFEMAEERNIMIMLTLINHGAFSTTTNAEWEHNPYNAALGGPCVNPGEFATDPEARDFFKRRLRYIGARWSYATNLLAWEWWNEVNWTPLFDTQLEPWIEEMTPVLRQHDGHNHLITNSYADGTRSTLWGMAELDFAQHHDYSGRDPMASFPSAYEIISKKAGTKPIVFGELGFAAGSESNTADLETVHFHNGLWTGPFTGYASTAMHWWWDSFVDAHDRWGEFKGISAFLAGEDLATMKAGAAEIEPADADALVLQGQGQLLVWIRSRGYDVGAAQDAYDAAILEAIKSKTILTEWTYEPPTLSGLTLTLGENLDAGSYRLRWFDPQNAAWLSEETVELDEGSLSLTVPDLAEDIALKIERR